MLHGNCCKHVLVDIPSNKLTEAAIAKEAGSEKRIQKVRRIENAFADTARVNIP